MICCQLLIINHWWTFPRLPFTLSPFSSSHSSFHLINDSKRLRRFHIFSVNTFYKDALKPEAFPPTFFLIFLCASADEEENPEFWRSQARRSLQSVLDRKLNTNVSRNILFFLGDGEFWKPVTDAGGWKRRRRGLNSVWCLRYGRDHVHGGSDPQGSASEPVGGGDGHDHGHVPQRGAG